jgi:hypothetical protein
MVTSPDYVQVKTCRVFLAPQDLAARHDELSAAARTASRARVDSIDSDIVTAAEALADLEEELEAYYVTFRFQALPRKQWADLLAGHAPTKEQLRADKRVQFNPETFPAVAIAACLIDPVMTVDQVRVLENGVEIVDPDTGDTRRQGGLNDTQFNVLFNTCVEVNVGGLDAPKSVAAGALRHLRSESGQPPTTSESPDLSSLDG